MQPGQAYNCWNGCVSCIFKTALHCFASPHCFLMPANGCVSPAAGRPERGNLRHDPQRTICTKQPTAVFNLVHVVHVMYRTCGKASSHGLGSKANECLSLVLVWWVFLRYPSVSTRQSVCHSAAVSAYPSRLRHVLCIFLLRHQGLGGMAFALLDANVVLTDTVDVVPLLKRNCEANLGCGTVQVRELGMLLHVQQYGLHGIAPVFECKSNLPMNTSATTIGLCPMQTGTNQIRYCR
eukprot:364426-Chlamydomonas_euryale.AAC.29